MSALQEVQEIIAEAAGVPPAKAKENVSRAHKEATKLMEVSGFTLIDVCHKIEAASTSMEARAAFKDFNRLMMIYLEAAPAPEHDKLLRGVLSSTELSGKLVSAIKQAPSVKEGCREYKINILQELARSIRVKESQKRRLDAMDDELFSTFLPDPVSPLSDTDPLPAADVKPKPPKRKLSKESELKPAPKKPRVPDLATAEELFDEGNDDISTRKKVLLTREKLRASLHNPKGLLDLVGSSTSALDHTKRLEMLKGAGMSLKGTRSFSDRLNAAIQRLDLGLGGHTMDDTLLFGSRVLSCPGFLTKKNTTEIENNLIHGTSSWRHQNAYAKMMIAGCMNQAKRIFQKFDEVLYGPAPEQLIKETHQAIRSLLCSEDGAKFFAAKDEASLEGDGSQEFIKRIVEAVSPIIPVTLRNKALDGGYLRTALLLLNAAEFLFAQYEQDIREKANPAGVVGMAVAMHAEFKRSTLYNEDLKTVQELGRDLQSQYQTSMGLGSSFGKDSMLRGRSRSRRFRGRGGYASSRPYQGWANQTTHQPFAATTRGTTNVVAGRGQGNVFSMRRRGVCYDYQAGTCLRGGACRYFHT